MALICCDILSREKSFDLLFVRSEKKSFAGRKLKSCDELSAVVEKNLLNSSRSCFIKSLWKKFDKYDDKKADGKVEKLLSENDKHNDFFHLLFIHLFFSFIFFHFKQVEAKLLRKIDINEKLDMIHVRISRCKDSPVFSGNYNIFLKIQKFETFLFKPFRNVSKTFCNPYEIYLNQHNSDCLLSNKL